MVQVIKRLALVFFMVLLAGCSPKYDWREVSTAGGRVQAIFPDKPRSESRTTEIEGVSYPFTMDMALVDDQVFAVVYSLLPEAKQDEASTRKAGEALLRSIYASMNETLPEPLPPFGQKLTFRKAVGNENASVYVKVFAGSGVIAQAYAAGQDNTLKESVADEFLNGMTLR
ncbi:MAG TPA: hypothetical protein DD666_05380 [Advenella kashmirensis]|uniref:Lipoprotein n=1 Tax=Advenella kashmirensis TaxID=310575 RepID=A0A356LE39_9BURK|nr:hypothetical protein [Advenella kashmirensis]